MCGWLSREGQGTVGAPLANPSRAPLTSTRPDAAPPDLLEQVVVDRDFPPLHASNWPAHFDAAAAAVAVWCPRNRPRYPGSSHAAMEYIKDHGIVDASCAPFENAHHPCDALHTCAAMGPTGGALRACGGGRRWRWQPPDAALGACLFLPSDLFWAV